MTTLGTWKKVGSVRVDTAMVVIADPCQLVHPDKPEKALGKDWDAFCKGVSRAWGKTRRQGAQLRFDTRHDGLAVVVGTGYGDSTYAVWGRFDGDVCCEIRLSFDGLYSGMREETCEIEGCASRGKYLCDFPIKKRGQKTMLCDRCVCAKHRHEPPDEVDAEDYCPEHAKPAKKLAAKAATPRKAGK